MAAPDASVLIPSYNERATLPACLERLSRQSCPLDRFEVLVVLDGSTDGSREVLERLTLPLRLRVLEQPNQGRAAALNHAAREARGKVLIVTDADILVGGRFVQSHLEGQARADVVVGPIPLAPQSPRNFLTEGVRRWAERYEAQMLEQGGPRTCAEIYGANLSIKKAAFEAIGGYRTDLRRTEDHQLGKKILDAGYRIAFVPEARAEQIYDKTIRRWCADFYQDGVSHARFLIEFPEERQNLKIGRYYPQTPTKRLLRPLVIRDRWLGRAIVGTARAVLEPVRAAGFVWSGFRACQSVIGDALFWKGVYDEVGDPVRFEALTRNAWPRGDR